MPGQQHGGWSPEQLKRCYVDFCTRIAPLGGTSSWFSMCGSDGTKLGHFQPSGWLCSLHTNLPQVGKNSSTLLNGIPLCYQRAASSFLSSSYLRFWFSCPAPEWIHHNLHWAPHACPYIPLVTISLDIFKTPNVTNGHFVMCHTLWHMVKMDVILINLSLKIQMYTKMN